MKINEITIVKHATNDVLGSLPRLLNELGKNYKVIDITQDSLPDVSSLECVFIMGSMEAAYDDSLPWLYRELVWLQKVIEADVPILGICFGSQLLARALGGKAYKNVKAEHAWVVPEILSKDWQHKGPWFSFHFDTFDLPDDVELLARTKLAKQAYRKGKVLGLQFHPEIDLNMFNVWLNDWNRSKEGRLFLSKVGDLPQKLSKEIKNNEQENYDNFRNLLLDFFSEVKG